MSEYWTVGEFARRAGVTVRTIQYYDQQKLLKPSAKGPQNRRLYSREDERELQRILVLKFLGNSLSDIRSALAGGFDGPEVAELIDRQGAPTRPRCGIPCMSPRVPARRRGSPVRLKVCPMSSATATGAT